ncbi:two-component system C4-dicarboxylate transport response regulator DctD [Hoeflea marina]|uniref:C4-dicarboxylate transport transcriptional regulatory protein DctD n=1 Tax=Hoeflea marina TaxID=274592 RepID=A0A317PC95_9HYPH|nr:sigma-54 dependent transcriptional regulator [Hoeflea marina]PWV95377.1 two-component system C4-dicarboxylate transport response regulator DctD [Hoeflea marina]
MSGRGRVLLVDDDADLLAAASDWLQVSGFEVTAVADPHRVAGRIDETDPDVVVTDIRMPGRDGMALLSDITAGRPDLPVVLMTGHGDVALAVSAMRQGAEDFIEKPYDADHLVSVLDRAVGKRRMGREIARLKRLVAAGDSGGIIGDSSAMRLMRDRIATLAAIDIDVLIIGETGTGKELVARALHDGSPRRAGPFVAVNCAAIPESIFESEVFGHARGAFTGAQAERKGKFEYADGGTIFLDEIESMPAGLQAKILRVLQERQIERLGDNVPRRVDIRVVTAAKTDLGEAIAGGGFRQDLFYRLAGTEIRIPPLRHRKDDIPLLFTHFARMAAQRHGRPDPEIGAAIQTTICAGDWPGNVRELKARAERFALGLDELAGMPASSGGTAGSSLPDRLAAFEIAEIRAAMDACDGRCAMAAERLGIPRRTLNEKLSRFGLRGAVAKD